MAQRAIKQAENAILESRTNENDVKKKPKSQIEMRQILMDNDEQYFDVEEVEDDLRQEERKRVFKIDDEDGDELNSPTDLIAKAELEPLSPDQKKLSQD